ncbi:MAG TPA: hypothetical protein VIC27_12490, partial [Ktedonobacterales bacterium]
RMEFGAQAGEPGFVWAELTRNGVRHVEHLRVQAQPRADITLHTSRLWPATVSVPAQRAAPVTSVTSAEDADAQDETNHALDIIRAELEAVCTPDTLARLRLTGTLTREQYHQLALRDVIALGQQRAFSLDVDTSGLTLVERAFALPDLGPQAKAISPAQMIALVVEETLQQSKQGAAGLPGPSDIRAAGDLLLARLRASGEEGA